MTGPEIAHEPLPEAAPAPAPAASEDGAEPRRQGTPFLVLQFFLFPMAIVAVCVGVFIVFGLIANEGKGAREYLDEIKSGSANRRWQAAFELSKVLQAGKDKALADPRFVPEVLDVYRNAAGDDPRVLGTIDAVMEDLMADGLLLRYRTETGVDGLAGDEHPFLACSFWLVSALAHAGRREQAEELMDRLCGLANDVGLLSEEYDAAHGRMAGNFPQAFSHLTLVQAALALR